MKRHPKSPRRGGASSRAETSSEPPCEPAHRQPATQRTASTRRSLIWPIGLIALSLVLAVTTSTTWILARDAAHMQGRLQLANANSLLAAQQLDAVFEVLWNHFPKDQQLTPSDRALLQTWMRFDEKYVFDNAANPQFRFQCAAVHRRIGQGTFMLGNVPDALGHLHRTIDLLECLVLDQPTITSYRTELADAYVRMAWVLHAQGDADGIEDSVQRAVQQIDDAPLLNNPAYNAKSASVFSSLADLAQLRAEHTRVRPLLDRSAQLYRELLKGSPEIEEYRALLTQVEAKLASTNQAQP